MYNPWLHLPKELDSQNPFPYRYVLSWEGNPVPSLGLGFQTLVFYFREPQAFYYALSLPWDPSQGLHLFAWSWALPLLPTLGSKPRLSLIWFCCVGLSTQPKTEVVNINTNRRQEGIFPPIPLVIEAWTQSNFVFNLPKVVPLLLISRIL